MSSPRLQKGTLVLLIMVPAASTVQQGWGGGLGSAKEMFLFIGFRTYACSRLFIMWGQSK